MLIGGGNESAGGVGVKRDALVDPRLVFPDLPGQTREQVLEELARRVAGAGFVREPGELAARLLEREKLGCTGLGGGIAIPHCKLKDLEDVLVAVASTQAPVDFSASDGIPVDLIFLVVSPAQAAAAHLQALARVSRLLRAPGVVQGLRTAASPEQFREALREAEAGLPVPQ